MDGVGSPVIYTDHLLNHLHLQQLPLLIIVPKYQLTCFLHALCSILDQQRQQWQCRKEASQRERGRVGRRRRGGEQVLHAAQRRKWFHNSSGEIPERQRRQGLRLFHCGWHGLAKGRDRDLREDHLSEWTGDGKGHT